MQPFCWKEERADKLARLNQPTSYLIASNRLKLIHALDSACLIGATSTKKICIFEYQTSAIGIAEKET